MKYINAGALIRGQLRTMLLFNGIDFKEDRRFLISHFYIDCSDYVFNQIVKQASKIGLP